MKLIIMSFLPIEDSLNKYVLDIIFFLGFALFITLFNQRIQVWMWIREAEGALRRLHYLASSAKSITIKTVKELGNPNFDPTPLIEDFLDFFYIAPVSLDPAGVIRRLEHVLNTRDRRIEAFARKIAPNADPTFISNIEGLLEATIVLNTLYREIRHLLLLSKKTKSVVFIMQLQMYLPIILRYAEAFFGAVDAFSNGKPIGDGVGALVAAKLMRGKPYKEIAKNVVASEFDFEGRKVIVIKAKGPGAEVGKPGEAIARIVAQNGGSIARIIMVDAAAKLEGEKTGRIAEGVGAAIGDPGPEKYKIEEIAVKYNIPIDAIAIKISLEEAITVMRREVLEAAEKAVQKVLDIIRERVKEGETVIIAGIGNTIGIGQ
ncbi:MAG: DUF1512 domain-containing protein [archaeon GB-1867-005]|nr:DUF1512 domain-containing protein [Candidatus Culexmicrobium cathedralense]